MLLPTVRCCQHVLVLVRVERGERDLWVESFISVEALFLLLFADDLVCSYPTQIGREGQQVLLLGVACEVWGVETPWRLEFGIGLLVLELPVLAP